MVRRCARASSFWPPAVRRGGHLLPERGPRPHEGLPPRPSARSGHRRRLLLSRWRVAMKSACPSSRCATCHPPSTSMPLSWGLLASPPATAHGRPVDRDPAGGFTTKSALLVRPGASDELSIPPELRGRMRIAWGSPMVSGRWISLCRRARAIAPHWILAGAIPSARSTEASGSKNLVRSAGGADGSLAPQGHESRNRENRPTEVEPSGQGDREEQLQEESQQESGN